MTEILFRPGMTHGGGPTRNSRNRIPSILMLTARRFVPDRRTPVLSALPVCSELNPRSAGPLSVLSPLEIPAHPLSCSWSLSSSPSSGIRWESLTCFSGRAGAVHCGAAALLAAAQVISPRARGVRRTTAYRAFPFQRAEQAPWVPGSPPTQQACANHLAGRGWKS